MRWMKFYRFAFDVSFGADFCFVIKCSFRYFLSTNSHNKQIYRTQITETLKNMHCRLFRWERGADLLLDVEIGTDFFFLKKS